MTSESPLNLKVADVENLSYENADTWLTRIQVILDRKEIRFPV
jgi:hypothetical protein